MKKAYIWSIYMYY